MIEDQQRDKNVQRVILVEGLANAVVLLAKLLVGFSTGSLAILGDAIHSLTDVINNIVAWVVIRLSSMPPDREHPYGHRKFETLAVFFLASLLLVFAFELALRTFTREAVEISSTPWGLGTMLVVLLINISLAVWQRMWARRLNSNILMADATHTFSDALTTVVVIVGWQLSAAGYVWLDQVCALLVAGLIFYMALGLFKSVLPSLVDEFALDPEMLSATVKKVPGVRQVNRVRSRWVGVEKTVDIVISVDSSLSTFDSHKIATEIEVQVEKTYGVTDISIHVEPYETPDTTLD